MALRLPALPQAAIEAYRVGLPDFFESTDLKPFPADPREAVPQQIYNLGLRDIVARTGLTKAVLVGWRFLTPGAQTSKSAGASVAKFGNRWSVTSVSRGPGIEKALEAARNVHNLTSKHPAVIAAQYEVRLLAIPGLLTDAFWLKSLSGKADLVIPYETLIEDLDPAHVYRADEFLKTIRPVARKALRPLPSTAPQHPRKRPSSPQSSRPRRKR